MPQFFRQMYSFLPSSDLRDFPEDQQPPSPRRLARQSQCPSSLLSRPRHPHPLHPRGRKGSDRSNEKDWQTYVVLFQLLMRYGQKVSQRACDRLDCLILAHAFQNPLLALLKIFLHAQQTCFASAFDQLIRLGNELLSSDPRVLLEDKIPVMGLGMVKHFRSNCATLALSTRCFLFQNSGSQRLSTDMLIEE